MQPSPGRHDGRERKIWQRRMSKTKQPFILFGTVRTGSYHLVSLLNSAPDIRCYGEVYKRQFVELPQEALDVLGLGPKDTQARNEMRRSLPLKLAETYPESAVGFKLFPNHIGGAKFLQHMMLSGNFRVLILSRALLEVYVSLELAKMTGTFTVTREEDKPEEPQMTATPESLEEAIGFIGRFRHFTAMIRAQENVVHHDIRYDEIGMPTPMDQALAFLGSEARHNDLRSDQIRQSSRPLHARVANWEWLVKRLRETDQCALLGEAGYRADGTPFSA